MNGEQPLASQVNARQHDRRTGPEVLVVIANVRRDLRGFTTQHQPNAQWSTGKGSNWHRNPSTSMRMLGYGDAGMHTEK